MKQTIREWRERTTTSLTQTSAGRNYAALCPICGARESAVSEGDDAGQALARNQVEAHILANHPDRIESEDAHQVRLGYLAELRKAIKATHGCDAVHLEAAPVREVFHGKTVWDGDVEVFAVEHAKAGQCFAWGAPHGDAQGWNVTAVLSTPPVVTPQLAVKSALTAHARQAAARQSDKS